MKLNRYRRGIVEITNKVIEDEPDILKKYIFSKMIVVRCEHMYIKDAFEYHAYSDEFDEVELGVNTPLYTIEIERGKRGKAKGVRFIRQN